MIKLEHVVLPSADQMEFVIEGMRNPMNSWDKSDSSCGKATRDTNVQWNAGYFLGTNDADLMRRLSAAGTDHRKFMRMMPVMVRITAPLYWWKEFDTYKVGTVANSCSTMHKIQEKEFTWDDFSCEHLIYDTEDPMNEMYHYKNCLVHTLNGLNSAREHFLETKDKKYWWQMIQLLPSSYNQTRNVILNYEVLANIYKSRKNHKLDEWRLHDIPEEHKDRKLDFASGMWGFCDWIKSLPHSELITGENDE